MRTKYLLTTLSILIAATAFGQLEMKTTTFDLEAAGLNVGWKILDGGTQDGKIFITYGKANCNMSKDKDFWSTTYTYKGLAWDFNKVLFSPDLQYQNTEKKQFDNTKSALSYAPVFGKYFYPTPTASVGSSLLKGTGGLTGRPFTADYIGQKVVAADIAITGFKIAVSRIDTDIQTFTDPKTGRPLEYCNESPVYALLSSESAKEEKGQRWIAQFSDPVINGGNILFATSGVYNEPGKAHYVFRSYETSGSIKKELIFTTDYYAMVSGNAITLADGSRDYIVTIRTVDYTDKKAPLGSKDATFMEYLRIDGKTLELKERIAFNSKTSAWLIEEVLEKDGAVYLMGPAGGNTDKAGFTIYRNSKDLTNFQITKFKGGKLEYVTSTGADEFEAKSQVMPGTKGKGVGNVILLPSLQDREYEIVNGRVMISAQQMTVDKYGFASSQDNMVLWSFDTKGQLIAQYVKPESSPCQSDLIFNKDGSKAYWALYDYDVWNKVDLAFTEPKDYKFIAPQLQIATIDNSTNKIESFQVFGEEEYALAFKNELLFVSDTHVGFNGRSLSKKAKDSDLVLITFKK